MELKLVRAIFEFITFKIFLSTDVPLSSLELINKQQIVLWLIIYQLMTNHHCHELVVCTELHVKDLLLFLIFVALSLSQFRIWNFYFTYNSKRFLVIDTDAVLHRNHEYSFLVVCETSTHIKSILAQFN